MKKFRFLCIAPYEGLYHLMNNLAAQRGDVEMTVQMGNMEDGLRAVLSSREQEYDAVISRGGTADYIRQHVDIPSCDIVPSVFDVLRAIRLAQGMEEEFAVVGFPSIAVVAGMLSDILQYSFPIRIIHGAEECSAVLRQLRQEGIRTIVGDMISVDCARELGMRGFLIVSGIEGVEAAIDSAKEMCSHYAETNKQYRLLRNVLKSDISRHVVYTSEGELVFSSMDNMGAELQTKLQKWVSAVITQGAITRMMTVKNASLTIKGRRLVSSEEEYCVYAIVESELDFLDKYRIRYLSVDNGPPGSKPMEFYVSGNSYNELSARCERYAQLDTPVLIEGERGTGKDRFAHYIYAGSKRKHSSLVVIDCCVLDDSGWSYLLGSDSSPLTDSGITIYFNRVNTASVEHQRDLWIYLNTGCLSKDTRLMFSYSTHPRNAIQEDLYFYLLNTAHCLTLQLPPLNQRREEIPGLISLYINAINVQSSTRVIGFTREAVALLQSRDWPQNADELYSVVQNLVINAGASYISEEEVARQLDAMQRRTGETAAAPLDLHQSLDRINHDIVKRVYLDENMNQARTAKRLGISRTTVWRLLKEDAGEP